MKKLLVIILLVIGAFLTAAQVIEDKIDELNTGQQEITVNQSQVALFPKAKDFVLYSTNVRSNVRLTDYHGKVVVVFFWASWDRYSKKEHDVLISLKEKFKKSDFEVLAVAMDEREDVKKFIRKNEDINYPVLYGSKYLMDQYHAYGIPVVFILDKDLRIREKYNGYVGKNTLAKAIKKVL